MTYKDGTVFLQHNRKWSPWYMNIIPWAITNVSGSEYIHVQVMLNGVVYESRWPEGFCKGFTPADREYYGDRVLTPSRDLTPEEIEKQLRFWRKRINEGVKYGTSKLVIFILLACTKPFWQWIKWTPMSNDFLFGDFCSAAVDNSYKAAGIDLFPKHSEEYTAPGDFANCWFLK